MVDPGSLVLLMSIFGVRIAIVYVVMGLMIAVVGGSLIEKLHMEDQIADFIRNANSSVDIETPSLTVKERLIYAKDQVVSTVKKVFPYILIGVGIGAVIHNWIPESWIRTVLGGCKSCEALLASAKEAVAKKGIDAEIEYITDMEKIMGFGVMSMPALMIDGKVVSAGKVLKAKDVEKLL